MDPKFWALFYAGMSPFMTLIGLNLCDPPWNRELASRSLVLLVLWGPLLVTVLALSLLSVLVSKVSPHLGHRPSPWRKR